MTSIMDRELRSPFFTEMRSKIYREAHAEGAALGKGEAVLTVLEARGMPVSEAVRERIRSCTDLDQIDVWLRRASTASSLDEVVRD